MNDTYTIRQHRERRPIAIFLAILIGSIVAIPVSADSWNLVDLGIDFSPTDINNNGTIVGSRKTVTGNVAFRWLVNGMPEDITGATIANAVNESDQVAGKTLTGAFLY
ncbi:MAG TPA: hypothetical protein VET88_09975, partial [Gammaproteobacteria bacterium]|nr:hypothetical protein [Gammaproteobacteria bacterium]